MSLKEIAKTFRNLQPEDFRVLVGIELGLGSRAHVPVEEISKYANLPRREVEFRLTHLDRLGLIKKIPSEQIGYEGYVMNYAGYDCLGLNALVKASAISAIGRSIAMGKESDVYEGLAPRRRRVALKFHRLGRTSFRQTRRKRSFVADRSHITWYYQSRLAANREYSILKRLCENRVSVPRPIAQNRHIIVMQLVTGIELNDIGEVDAPRLLLIRVLKNVRMAYTKARIIHADLSKFNILTTLVGRIFIIDWPQAIRADHPNAEQILRRDLQNILLFFEERFAIDCDLEKVLSYVRGTTSRTRDMLA